MYSTVFKPSTYEFASTTQWKALILEGWELMMDCEASEKFPHGKVDFVKFVVRLTKRQIRQEKRKFRKSLK